MRSRRIVLATGDRADAADAVGALTGVDEVLAGLTPEEKLDVVRGEQGRAPVIMIGDGINDAPALALADVGIAIGARGSTASSEAADAVPAVWGALLQEGIDVTVILNALRAVRTPARNVRLTAADTALTRRFRTEHQAIRADIDQVRAAAEALDAPGAMKQVRQVHDMLASPRGEVGGPRRRDAATEAERQAEHQRMLDDESAESLAAGVAQWEVRAEFRSHHEAAALAGKLRMEGREAPADATVRAQHSPAYLPFTGF